MVSVPQYGWVFDKKGWFTTEIFALYCMLGMCPQLIQKMGVHKDLALNMSIPLGVVDITLEESIAMYEGILTGQRYNSEHDDLYRLIDTIYYTPHPFDEGEGSPILLYSAPVITQEVSAQRSGGPNALNTKQRGGVWKQGEE